MVDNHLNILKTFHRMLTLHQRRLVFINVGVSVLINVKIAPQSEPIFFKKPYLNVLLVLIYGIEKGK